MSEKVKFIASYLEAETSFSELCDRFGVSRKTGYKWVDRYENGGVESLVDRPRKAHTHPHATSRDIVDKIVTLRKRYPRWGPRKLLVVLRRREPGLELPAPSTAGVILKRHGLIGRRRPRIRSAPYESSLGKYARPNAIWCADFKGHFYVGNRRCHPLTISDGFSRFLVRCEGLHHSTTGPSRTVFESAFREFGLPDAIRTDNGPPFSSLAPGGLSPLAVWWIRLGIRPERIRPGHPEENGRHERMHRTLKAETAKPPRTSFMKQQRAFDEFRREYNHDRPHEAICQAVPASLYRASLRKFPRKLPQVEYPAHFFVARAYPNGVISFRCIQWYISASLRYELVGLEPIDEDRWKVYFGPVALGIADLRFAKERGYRQFARLIRTDGRLDAHHRNRLGR